MNPETSSSEASPYPLKFSGIPTDSRSPQLDMAHIVCQFLRTKPANDEVQLELRWSLRGSFFPAYPIHEGNLQIAIKKSRDILKSIVLYFEEKLKGPLDICWPAVEDLPALNRMFAELAQAGYELHNILLPTSENQAVTVAKWLKGLIRENRIASLEILIEDHCTNSGAMPAVPWNLVYDAYVDVEEISSEFASDAPTTWGRFWGVRFDLSCGQNVNPLKSDHRIDPKTARAVIVMDEVISGDLLADDARKTAFDQLIASINATGESDAGDPHSTPVVTILNDVNSLKRYVRKNGLPNLLYWLSHASPDALFLQFAAPSSPSEKIKLYDLAQILSTRAKDSDDQDATPPPDRKLIAFLNGCHTSASSLSGSFLRTFTQFDQVSGLITTEQLTLPFFAHYFGMKFLASFFLDQKPIGTILRDLRRETLPLGLLYGTYCPPTIRLAQPAKAKKPAPIPVALSDYLGESLRKLSAAALAPSPAVPTAPPRRRTTPEWPEKPYPSLGFYTVDDQALFLGRDDDSARLAELIDTPATRILLLHGTSGSGKSSVIRAGLVPYLEKYAVGYRFLLRPQSEGMGESERLHLFFRPSDNFAARLAADLLAFTDKPYELEPRPDGTPQSPANLRPILAACVDPHKPDVTLAGLQAALSDSDRPDLLCEILDALTAAIPEKIVVTIDQAEELYTLAQGDTPDEIRQAEERRRQAFALLRECLRGSGRWKIVLSYRTEYHGRITDGIRQSLRKTPGLVDYLITDLSKTQLRRVIEHPTLDFPVVEGLEPPREKYRFTYEPGVIDAIVDGIFRLRGRNTDSVLPIVQVVCTRLYEQARGEVDNGQLAEIKMGDLDRLRHKRQLERNVSAERTPGPDSLDSGRPLVMSRKRRSKQGQAKSAKSTIVSGDEEPVLEILKDFAETTLHSVANGDRHVAAKLKLLMMQLYLTQPDGTLTTAQIGKTQVLQQIRSGSRKDFDKSLTEAAKSRLLRLETSAGSHETEEGTIRLGHDTLCKVVGRWDAAEQAKRRVRKFQIGTIVAVAICGVMGIFYLRAETAMREAAYLKGIAEENENRAIREKENAEKLAANANLILAANLFDQGQDLEVRKKLFAIPVDQRSFPWRLLKWQLGARSFALSPNHSGPVNSVDWSPDGRIYASGSNDWTVKLWDWVSGRLLVTLEGHTDVVKSVAFSGNGKTLASGSSDNSIRLWDVQTGTQRRAPMTGHTAPVNSVAFSPDGKTLASGSDDNTIRLWDVQTGTQRGATMTGHTDPVTSVAFSPDGKTLASGSSDNSIRLWDVQTGTQRGAPMNGHTGRVTSVAFSPDGKTLASGSDDNTIRLWDVQTGTQRGATMTGHTDPVTSVAFSPDGKTLASGSDDNTIRLWDVQTGTQRSAPMMTGHTGPVYSVAFSPDGKTLASGSWDETIRLWDVQTGTQRSATMNAHTNWVLSVAFSPDGKTLASGSSDNSIRLWDVQTGTQRRAPMTGHTAPVNSVAFSPDGKTLASGSDDNTIRLWDVQTGTQRGATMNGHTGRVTSVAFSPDGKTLASGSSDNTIRLWDVQTGTQRGATMNGHTGRVTSVAFSPDGKTLASGSSDNTIRLWDVQTGTQRSAPMMTGHTGPVYSVAFSPDGKTLASGSDDNTIRLWDVQTGTQRSAPMMTGHTGPVYSVAFSPDGKTLASGSWDETIRLWDVQTGTQRGAPMNGHTGRVNSVAFSPDGKTLASGSWDNTIRLWDVQTGTQRGAPMNAHTNWVLSVAFSPDGKTLASGSWDETIRLWDVQTGTQRGATMNGHTGRVYSVAFSPDGKTLASGSDDNTIRLWDVQTGTQRGAPMNGHTDPVNSVAFSPDGKTLASGSWENTIRLWDVQTGTQRSAPMMTGHTGPVYSVAFSPDGKTLASGSWDETIRLWDVQTGTQRGATMNGHTNWVYSVAFSGNGKTLASGSSDNSIRLWDVQTGTQRRAPMTGHTAPVNSVAFSPDGKTLASGSSDKTIRLWDVETGTEVRNITLEGSLSSVAFTTAKDSAYSMGRSRLAAAAGKDIRIWDSEFNAIDAQNIRRERIARNFLRNYPHFDEAIAAIRRNETLSPEEKDRIAGIIQPLLDFLYARSERHISP